MVQYGKLDLAEDINQKLLSWKIPENHFTKGEKVTLRRLLSHTAGTIVSGFRGYSIDEQVPIIHQILDGIEPSNSVPIRVDTIPGTQWRYSGGGVTVVQQLLMDMTGKPFPDIMRDFVLERLEMKQSTYEQPLSIHLHEQAARGHDENGEKVNGGWFAYPEMAAAGLWTTPSDLACLAIELQKSKAGRANRVLSVAMTNEMLSDQMHNFPKEMVSKRYERSIRNQGLGFRLEGEGSSARFSHHGGNIGYCCFIVAYSEVGKGAVVMTNSDNGSVLIPEIIQSITTEYGWVDRGYHAFRSKTPSIACTRSPTNIRLMMEGRLTRFRAVSRIQGWFQQRSIISSHQMVVPVVRCPVAKSKNFAHQKIRFQRNQVKQIGAKAIGQLICQ